MGIAFTKEQQQVIDLRGRNILVSAAAGSGKTAVLVERIITRLTKDVPPLDVDRLLIVTFTEAAASEMKERIHDAIEKALEDDPDNVHLQRQSTLIHQAQIMTIHKFCLSVIRDYFHTIDLDPGFRVAEEGELKLLKRDVVEAVLETAYQEGNEAYIRFVESFAAGKDDRKLEELILQLYELSRSHPDPKEWLESCVKQYDIASVEEMETQPFVQEIMNEIQQYLQEMIELLEFGMKLCAQEDGPKVYEGTLSSDSLQLRRLQEAKSFAQMQQAIEKVQWDKLVANRDKTVSERKISQVKNIRDEVKGMVKTIAQQYFYDDVSNLQKDISASKEHMETLTGLVQTFAIAFSEEKKRKNLIDFNDMEQYALQILTDKKGKEFVPSAVAESYQMKFEEVMIDEYQDSNLVQEAILTSVSRVSKGEYNVFMVGDVKQSIYRFRLSRPDLFMEKFNTYSLTDSKTQRVDLHKNFRSRREVLVSTNFVFQQIMTKPFGGISYDERAALYLGADYEEKAGNETELLLLDAQGYRAEERVELEAQAVAMRIKELMASHSVLDKKTGKYRSMRYSDIVILSRSLKGWTDVFGEVLNQEGIPTYTGSKEGYFGTREVQLVLNYLKILDNPRQDIPFAAVLTSMFADISSEELAIIQSNAEGKTLYERVCHYAENGESEKLKRRLENFLQTYHGFRKRVSYTAIHMLLWELFEETGYGDYTAALPAGEQRAANLEMLIEKAVAFEGTSYKGLFNFVRYIEQLQKYDVDYGEANLMDEQTDVVCLMSIHKSLEFPIVFVTGMGKAFNMQDTRGSIVVHPEMGIGIDRVDAALRVKSPTLIKKAMQQKVQRESTAEELRVLYVAMTRAKEKLILTGSATNLERDLDKLAALSGRQQIILPYYSLTGAGKYMDWLLASLYRNRCFANLLEQYQMEPPYSNRLYDASLPIRVRRIDIFELFESELEEDFQERVTKEILKRWDTKLTYNEEMKQNIEEQFTYEYPEKENRIVKQKLSVSELKKRAYMEEEGEEVFREEEVIPLLPKFLQEEETLTGASKGTAYHKLLEVLDFTKEYDMQSLQEAIQSNREKGFLTEEMANCISPEEILTFLQSAIGQRVQQACRRGQYVAEQPFVVGVDASQIYPELDSDEIVLVQGIIDVYFEEDGELVVLDYKTDKVFRLEDLTQRYRAQLDYYGEALERLTGKPVKQKMIYSFALQAEIEV